MDTAPETDGLTAVEEPMYEWSALPWTQIERQVFKLQTRIYRASKRGDVRAVHRLQRLLMASKAAKYLAVRKVTQDNRGKKTAGVDGVKSLSPERRSALAATLTLRPKAQPARRVWIPKPGSAEKRPLGIPVMRTRAEQALAKLVLEPAWEARFEANSYGFRPGRSAHDAVEAIFNGIRFKPKYVLDADIAKCFDRIDHHALLDKLRTTTRLRRAVRGWLKAGVVDDGALFPTEKGTPQGGVASPLLANIALHGLETAIRDAFPVTAMVNGRRVCPWQPIVIRYADDVLVLHEDRTVIERCQRITMAWLANMGLELKPSKTRITHTLRDTGGNVGFDFLGFAVRQHPVGKTHSGKNTVGEPLGYKTIITPSNEAVHRHARAMSSVIRAHKGVSQAALIGHLNPVIRGWVNYYATVVSKRTFSKLDAITYAQLQSWARRRHSSESGLWVARKYWRLDQGRWTFGTTDGYTLAKHSDKPIRRHTKVEGTKSPFDGAWVYWATRLGRHPELPRDVATLLKRQKGRCARCGLFFRNEDIREKDHIHPLVRGGTDGSFNRHLLHGHCHDGKTAGDGSSAVRGARDNRAR